jgi:orotate phosphoribosyltransferase
VPVEPSQALDALIHHLRIHAVSTEGGPFRLRSGQMSSWYIDARQTTFAGDGAPLVGAAVLERIPGDVDAVGGMTMGADPIALATAMAAHQAKRLLNAFSIRKATKDHGTGGRLVGPVGAGTRVVVLEDTTTTGGALIEAVEVARHEGLEIVSALSLVDRSGGIVAGRLADLGIAYTALITPGLLGVE